MSKIKLQQLLDDFQSALGYPYVSPGNTTMSTIKNGVDCSGLFVAAFKHQNGSIYHGSNTIWRDGSLSDKGVLTKTAQLFPGCAVFKWSSSGEPNKYVSDGEGNFQHIGLCISVNPLRIIHASTDGMVVKCDTKLGKWKYWGRLKNVDYNEEEKTQQTNSNTEEMNNVSTTTNGTLKTKVTLNIRNGKGTGFTKLGIVKSGVVLDFIGNPEDGWVQITYNGITGYICSTNGYVIIQSQNKNDIAIEQVNKIERTGTNQEQISNIWDEIQALRIRISELEKKF